ncbi:hypothetical protein R70211_01335 [Paraburkholderia domus]|uniref:Tyr recombinase domain-containing protein n=1 Tax=Paraburkholderia domus TaxID=2793075 RepID=A0A9N8QT10_9BURK|nr:site-specific integrase [Paraburkholderia domus]MBK5164838.1 site-specific integrase [Burkholderia sp. R-70211]CAE6872172.1 hypothetical protein R70211_01335 [Paraburkholderia domus]
MKDDETNPRDEYWLRVKGKGGKRGEVSLPPLAWSALSQYLLARGCRSRWQLDTSLIGNLGEEVAGAISSVRLWAVLSRFFLQTATTVADDNPPLANKLRRTRTRWMRQTHTTFALAHGAELTTVRDNLRHASISMTSIYLHGDAVKRARQIAKAFTES